MVLDLETSAAYMSSNMKDEGRQDQSLLEDASTLLMFSKTQNEGRLEDTNGSEKTSGAITSQEVTPTASSSGIAFNALTSPGPASVALVKDDEGVSEDIKGSNAKKGIVAAAALAQAAIMPLPLRKKDLSAKSASSGIKDEQSADRIVGTNHEQEDSVTEEKVRDLQHSDIGKENNLREADIASVPESYIVDPDDGIITCICGYDDDDGFTIQCDHCFRWQHAICYGIEAEDDAPDDFLCNICNPRDVDVKGARKKQQERLRNIQNKKRRRSVNATNREGKSKDVGSINKDSNQVDNIEVTIGEGIEGDQNIKSDPLRKQTYMTAKESYPAVYLTLTKNDFKDRYVEIFVNEHGDDDWVIPYSKKSFKPIPIEVKPYSDNNHSRIFPGFPKLGVYIKQNCEEDDLIEEYLGEVDFQRKYLQDPRNNYRIWGTAKPKVIFHPHWPIYIDARLSGNLTRYLRRCCNPNVELVTIRTNGGSNQDAIKFVLKAMRPIAKGEELLIKWDWDLRHPIWKLINNNVPIDSIEEPKRYLLIHSVDTVLGSCDCACGSSSKDCHLNKVKKFSQSLYRSVKSKMNNRYKLNEILHGKNLENKNQTPILCKLAHDAISDAARASEILLNFNASKLKGIRTKNSTKNRKRTRSNSFLNSRADKYVHLLGPLNKKISSNVTTHAITDPDEYDESDINDIEMLAIPVEIKIKESVLECDGMEHETTIPSDRKENSSKEFSSTDSLGISASKSTLNSQAFHPHVKKKLSFADYKKKLKPT